jgi:two-component system, OmpR family, sensor histidine kinase KdpD
MEKIVVCISNPAHAEKLIQRGKVLANAFNGECLVLNVLKAPFDELDYNQLQTKMMFESLAKKYEVEFFNEEAKTKKVSYQIADFVEKNNATQIVLGQTTKSRLELVLQESLINHLFEKLDGVDLHLVEVSREVTLEEEFDRGISATLLKTENGYHLSLKGDTNQNGLDGIFYQVRSTDFSNGFFVIKKEKEHQVIKVIHGKVNTNEVEL